MNFPETSTNVRAWMMAAWSEILDSPSREDLPHATQICGNELAQDK